MCFLTDLKEIKGGGMDQGGTSVDDGFSWRKYGHKDILGAKFPRSYYRCTHRISQGCLATKQVQRSDSDPSIFDVLYRGINGGLNLDGDVDASGRKAKGKGLYQFVDKYGANVDGYSPIYNPDKWSPSGDVYVGGRGGLVLWAITHAALLAGGICCVSV